jgi:hypothetical protein
MIASPKGIGPEKDCPGKDQQNFVREGAPQKQDRHSSRSVQNTEVTEVVSKFFAIYHQSLFKSRRMRCARHVARMEEKRNAYRILVGKSEGRRPLGRPRRKWVDSIKMYLREIGSGGIDWLDLAQDRD